jgi:hypothetical protein
MKASPLAGMRIGISISESPDMAVLGLGPEHLEDAMSEIARRLLACGASLVYGGDLRMQFPGQIITIVTSRGVTTRTPGDVEIRCYR